MRFGELNVREFEVNVAGGASDIALANLYGVSDRTVSRWRERLGLPSMYWQSRRYPCGTSASYSRGCRCEACTEANREAHQLAVQKMRDRGLPPGDSRHGTRTAYIQWACRCEPCTKAGAEGNRNYWIKRFGETPRVPRWTEREEFLVRALPPKEASRITGRSLTAVYQHRKVLGITRRSREGA